MDLNGPPPTLTENQLTPDELRRYRPRPGFTPATLADLAQARLDAARLRHLTEAPPTTGPPNAWENQMVQRTARNWRLAGPDFVRWQLGLVGRPASRLDVLRGMTAELVLAQPAPKGRRS